MAKTFNDIFPGGSGWEPANRSWRHKGTGHVVKEMPNSEIDGNIVEGLYCTTCEYAQPYVSKDLELIEEPTGREAIHAAVDAYLDAAEIVEMCSTNVEKARKNFEAEDHALYVSVQSRDERMEALKKLLNL